MTVEIELFGQLSNTREKKQTFEIDAPISVSEAALLAGVPAEQIGLAVLDGRQVTLEESIPQTCRLSLFPPMMGG